MCAVTFEQIRVQSRNWSCRIVLSCVGQVQAVQWSPSGSSLGFVAHDACAYFVNDLLSKPDAAADIQRVSTNLLPMRSLVYYDDDKVVAVGHNNAPYLFVKKDGKWILASSLEQKRTSGPAKQSSSMSQFSAAFEKVGEGMVELMLPDCTRWYGTN